MRYTPNPCWNDGQDCPNRTAECRITCEAWKKYLEKHKAEKDEIFREKQMRNDIEAFMALQGVRTRMYSATKAAKERREGLR